MTVSMIRRRDQACAARFGIESSSLPVRRWCRSFGFLMLLGAALGGRPAAGEPRWPQWRGPRGDGQAQETDLPVAWNAASVVWKVSLPGGGQSSPIVWGDRIFLTCALEEGRERVVLCLDRESGRIEWQRTAWTGEPEPIHGMNSWASATCATDGEVIVASFGRGGLHAFSPEGRPLWSQPLGDLDGPWGTAASPVIVDELVVQNADADSGARIVAFHKRTGEPAWSTPRPDFRGWSTPLLVDAAGRRELVVNGHAGVTGYEPATGRQLWFCKSFNGRGEPTITPVATPAGPLLCAVNGLAGDVYAIRPGGAGDVTGSHMAWHTPRRGGRDIPSPIVVGGWIVVVDLKGIATCYEAETGREAWKERLCDQVSASPVAARDLAYFLDESGTTTVIRPGPRWEVVARNALGAAAGETFRASPALAGGRVFVRSQSVLYCVK